MNIGLVLRQELVLRGINCPTESTLSTYLSMPRYFWAE